MRPRLLAETALSVTGAGAIRPVAGGGWLVCDPDADVVRVLDRRLRVAATVPQPHGDVATDGRHVAVVADGALEVSDVHGGVLWRRATTGCAGCHVDGRGILWTFDGDLLAAADVTTGDPFGHARLGTGHGWSDWIDDRLDTWTGLSVNHGDGTFHSWLARPTTDGVQVVALAGPIALALHHSEPRYLAMSFPRHRLSVRDLATGTVLAERSAGSLAGADAQFLTAVVVSESLVLAEFDLDVDTSDAEPHLLLSTSTLRPRSTVAYPHPARHHELAGSNESGVWLTRTDQSLCLWRLDGLLDDDPLPGQQSLF